MYTVLHVFIQKLSSNWLLCLIHRSTRNFNIPPPPPPGKPQAFEIVQIPASSRQNSVHMPYPVVGFVCLSPTFEDLFCIKPIALKYYISSFKLFHLVQTCVLWLLATLAPEKQKHLKSDSSGSIFPTPRRQRSNSPFPGYRR